MSTCHQHTSAVDGFSVSSFSRGLESCGTSVVDLSVPRIIAKSPQLVKARIAAGTELRKPNLARSFKLRGTRQQIRGSTNDGGTSPAGSPRPPSRIIVRPNVQDTSKNRHVHRATGSLCKFQKTIDKAAYDQKTKVLPTVTIDAPAGVSDPQRDHYAVPPDRMSADLKTAMQHEMLRKGFYEDIWRHPSPRNVYRTGGGFDAPRIERWPETLCRNIGVVPRSNGLCGRLWIGTTASSPRTKSQRASTAHARVLFLVSGQRQLNHRRNCDARRAHTAADRHSGKVSHGSRIPHSMCTLSSSCTSLDTEAPVVAATKYGRLAKPDIREESDDIDFSLSCAPPQDRILIERSAATALGHDKDKGVRRVLHVRVPRPPPTSILVLRSAR